MYTYTFLWDQEKPHDDAGLVHSVCHAVRATYVRGSHELVISQRLCAHPAKQCGNTYARAGTYRF